MRLSLKLSVSHSAPSLRLVRLGAFQSQVDTLQCPKQRFLTVFPAMSAASSIATRGAFFLLVGMFKKTFGLRIP